MTSVKRSMMRAFAALALLAMIALAAPVHAFAEADHGSASSSSSASSSESTPSEPSQGLEMAVQASEAGPTIYEYSDEDGTWFYITADIDGIGAIVRDAEGTIEASGSTGAQGNFIVGFKLRGASSTYPEVIPDKLDTVQIVGVSTDSRVESWSAFSRLTLADGIATIDTGTFSGCSGLHELAFERGSALSTIGYRAFDGSGIENLTLPARLTTIGRGSFTGAMNLKALSFEEGSALSGIRSGAFAGSGIESLTLPVGIATLESGTFTGASNLKTLSFEKGSALAEIRSGAFAGSGLERITLPAALPEIGDGAFSGTANLKELAFEKGSLLSSIGYRAFEGSGLERVTLPASLKTIGRGAFTGASSLKTLSFEKGSALAEIRSGAFAGSGLERVTLPAGLAILESGTFTGASSLKTLSFEKGSALTVIRSGAFAGSGLERITLPAGLSSIGEGAFSGTSNLKELAFEEGATVSSVGYRAFEGSGLESLTLPSSLKTLESEAFAGSTSLKTLSFEKGSALTVIRSGAFAGSGLERITLPAGLSSIGEGAFSGTSNLKELAFEEGATVSSVGYRAFEGSGLESLTLPESVTTLADGAFENASSLKVVLFDGSSRLAKIGRGAFKNSGVASITLPAKLAEIGEEAFYGASNLKEVAFESGTKVSRICRRAFKDSGLVSFTLPASLTTIEEEAFIGCFELANITLNERLSESVKTNGIHYNPFSGACNARFVLPKDGSDNYQVDETGGLLLSNNGVKAGLILYAATSVAFADNKTLDMTVGATRRVQRIANYAFAYNASVESITFSSKLRQINSFAFSYSGLTNVVIPSTVTYLGSYCFTSDKLHTVQFEEGFDLAPSVKKKAKGQFYGCVNLSSADLPTSITALPEGCFEGTRLTSVTLPDAVTSVPARAFANCARLNTIKGCAGVKTIEAHAFSATAPEAFPFENALDIEFVSEAAFAESADPDFSYPSNLAPQFGGYYRFDATISVSGEESYDRAEKVFDRINDMRLAMGLDELVMDADLMDAAMVRAAECAVHYSTSADGVNMRPLGVSFKTVQGKATAEIIAAGYSLWSPARSAMQVVDYWNGEDQKLSQAALANANYKTMGVGCFKHNNVPYWVVLFGSEIDAEAAVDASAFIGEHVERESSDQVYTVYIRCNEEFPSFRVVLSVDASSLETGDQAKLLVTYANPGADTVGIPEPNSFYFTVSNPRLVALDQARGTITVLRGGELTVTATLKGTDLSASCTVTIPPQVVLSESNTTVLRLIKKVPYAGKPVKQSLTVMHEGEMLAKGSDYTVKYRNNKKPGKASFKIVGKGNYSGTIQGSFKIVKGYQPLVATAEDIPIPIEVSQANALAVTAIKVKKAAGDVTYQNVSTQARARQLTVDAVTGKVIIPRAKKACTYKLKVNVTASGDANYKKGSQTVAFSISIA